MGELGAGIVSNELRDRDKSSHGGGRRVISNANLGWVVGLIALGVFVIALFKFRPF